MTLAPDVDAARMPKAAGHRHALALAAPPTNLELPPHRCAGDARIVIGDAAAA